MRRSLQSWCGLIKLLCCMQLRPTSSKSVEVCRPLQYLYWATPWCLELLSCLVFKDNGPRTQFCINWSKFRNSSNTDCEIPDRCCWSWWHRGTGVMNNMLDFWSSRRAVYSCILPLAEHLLSALASQAYVEYVFSLCGLLTAGRRNIMSKALEMRAFLKLNRHSLYVKCGRVAEYACLFFFEQWRWLTLLGSHIQYSIKIWMTGAFGTVLELVIWIRIRIRNSN